MFDLGPHLDDVAVAAGTNILLKGPPLTGKRRLALETLAAGSRRGDNAVVVTARDCAERVRDDYGTILGGTDDAGLAVVDAVSDQIGSAGADGQRPKYSAVPTDMTGITVKFAEFVQSNDGDDGVARMRVLVDSVSSLLMYSPLQTVFRSLHVFTARVENTRSLGLYIAESTAHDEDAMDSLEALFDGSISVDDAKRATLSLPGVANRTIDVSRLSPRRRR
ncbi:RAD55 family ATPase [Haloarcula marina]|uniref:RAD55 family ATPase n=1 Tax=Haloarcula marina TaxID=2961574 RepID=UPI0020B81594|nr:ATPase domain-containing protein [Halomicroarcula marina]